MALEALLCLAAPGALALLPFSCLAVVESWGLVACTGDACAPLTINGRCGLVLAPGLAVTQWTEMSTLLGAGVCRDLKALSQSQERRERALRMAIPVEKHRP